MSQIVRGYDAEGHKLFTDLGPGYARLSWSAQGSVNGRIALPERPAPPVREAAARDYAASIAKGNATKRLRGTT